MTSSRRCVIAIDAGTTGVRSRAIFPGGGEVIADYREFEQHYPQPGWVEHDPVEIWEAVKATLAHTIGSVGVGNVAAIGITNQRETVLAWNRRTGQPYGSAIVWQDRRTAGRCDQLTEAGMLPRVRDVTGLVLDPYFSGSKVEWLLANRAIPIDDELALGTIDSWLVWNLTGGAVHATDASNASRTMLFDIRSLQWSDEMCALFGVPMTALPTVMPSSGRFGVTSDRCGVPAGIPISGIAGDQQAALFGQACVQPGMAKNTYGTGSFILLNVGATCPPPADGMLTTVAWVLADGTVAYAVEGAIFVTGAAVQWLRDGLGIISTAAEVGPLAQSVTDNGGVYVVPAFAGLGSPWWDPYARHHRGHHSRHHQGSHRPCRRGGHGLPDPRRRRRDDHRRRRRDQGSARRRRRLGDGCDAATAGRPVGCHRAPARRPGDHRARRGISGGVGRRRVAVARGRCGGVGGRGPVRAQPQRAQADLDHAAWRRAVDRSRDWILH